MSVCAGAGKTTLMDVLAGRKTGGIIEGDIRLNGHPKEQASFARVSGASCAALSWIFAASAIFV